MTTTRVVDGHELNIDLAGPPRLPHDLLHRPRLYEPLDRHAPLTVLRGPTGVGKSTLVAAWAKRLDGEPDVAWLGFAASTDAAQFWAAVLTAVSREPMSPEDATATPEAVVEAGRRLTAPLTVVLDDFDLVESTVDGGLARVVNECEHIHLIVCLRGRRDLDSAAWVVPSAVVFGKSDLLLRVDEVVELAAHAGVGLTGDDAEQLIHATGGWTAPTKAALLELDASRPMDGQLETAMEASEQYVRGSVLPNELRSFLAPCSLVDELTVDQAAVLSGDDQASCLLADAEAYGLVSSVTRDGRQTYEVLPLLRRALAREFASEQPDLFRATHRLAAHWFLDAGVPELAALHAAHAEEWGLVGDIVDTHFVHLITLHPNALRTAFQHMPDEAMADRLRLRIAKQLAMAMPGVRGLTFAGQKHEPLSLRGLIGAVSLRDVVALGGAQAMALRTAYEYSAMRRQLDEIDAVLSSVDKEAAAEIDDLLPIMHLQWGIGRFVSGDIKLAMRDFTRAFHSGHRAGTTFVARNAADAIGLLLTAQGNVRQSQNWLERGQNYPLEETWFVDRVRTWGDVARCLNSVELLDVDAARATVAAAGDGTIQDELWPFICYAGAQYALAFGDPMTALNQIAMAEQLREGNRRESGLGGIVLDSAKIDLLLALGQGNRAVQVGQATSSTHPLIEVSRARADLLSGDLESARGRTVDLVWRPETDYRCRLDMLLIDAIAALRQGDEGTALVAAGRALSVAQSTGATRPFAWIPRPDAEKLLAPLAGGDQVLDRLEAANLREVFPADAKVVTLSEREHVVLERLAETGSVDQIAESLVVSANTVKSQRRSIYRKLGVQSRGQALEKARRLGLLEGRPTK